MKVNWGTGIVIAFIAFISFIMFFVIQMNTKVTADHELVTQNYYEQELAYQQEIDAQKAALTSGVGVQIIDNKMYVVFPENYQPEKVTGKVSLYRPSNRHLDFDLPISLSNTHLLIPDNRLIDGRWDITINWEYQGETFLHKQKITL